MRSLIVVLALVFFCNIGLSFERFAPDNSLYISSDVKTTGLTEKEFNHVIDTVVEIYRPVIEGRGATLWVNKDWESGTVNASANQWGDYWMINMYGGLARYDGMTADGYAMIVCHEFGHHLGGVPFWLRNGVEQWASCEGQSDYFAASKCFKQYADLTQTQDQDQGQQVFDLCDRVEDNEICRRNMQAGLDTATILAKLGNLPLPTLEDADDNVVETTIQTSYPSVQCRLDTYKAGSLCENDVTGEEYCAEGLGDRPTCWYRKI